MIKQILLSVLLMLTASSLWAFELVKEGKAVSKIYMESLDKHNMLPGNKDFDKMSLPQQYECILAVAVEDLNYHLKKMTGTKLEIVITADLSQVKSPGIVIGSLANRLGGQPEGKSELGETFRLKNVNGMLLIGGETPAAAAYGIYELLSILGCDWVMPGTNGEIIPESPTVTIPDIQTEQHPSFAVRCPWYSGGGTTMAEKYRKEFDLWKLRHKQQISREWHPLMMAGGHVWGALIRQYAAQFNKNPEMLSMVKQADGTMKRQGPQIETTNPMVIDIFADYIRNMFKQNKWPADKNVCIGVGPADGGGFSQSAESIIAGSGRIDPISGDTDITDLQILLCNQLIKLLENEFPNLRLGFYLYNTHADYPMRYLPNKKITIVIADITYSRFHGLNDPASKTRTYYREIIEQWGSLQRSQGNTIFFRGYNWNLAENFMPYTKLKIWGEDIPYYKKAGVTGFYNECSKSWAVLGPSNYLEAKLTWNAGLDWKQVLRRYCANAFGKGAPFIEKYYLMLAERQSMSGQEAGSYFAFALIYDRNFIKEALHLFEQAEKEAEKTAEKQRVSFARIPMEMLRCYFDFRDSYCSFDFADARRKFELMKNELQRYESIDANLICRSSARYLDRFYGKFVEQAAKYSTEKYRIVYRLPDCLKTAFDSTNSGQNMGFFNTEINDNSYINTATFSSTWDAQGLMGYRAGSVWYRIPFNLTAHLAGQPLGLFVGGADSIVRVWCNGKYIGMGDGFATPFLFDLTGFINGGHRNLLVIQVQRFGNSEIGTGGLIYPSFVFSGPRLESLAPKLERNERVLPGGERESGQ